MARYAEDREDLMRDAVALVERISILLGDKAFIVGFRRCGAGSLYVGADPAYHFNSRHELRRAIVADVLYKAQSGKLLAIHRERSIAAVVLHTQPVDAAATATLLSHFENHRSELLQGLQTGSAKVLAAVPPETAVLTRSIDWLTKLAPPVVMAATPRVS